MNKQLLIIASVLLLTACAGTGSTMPADVKYVCGLSDSSRGGMVMVNGRWQHCRYEDGMPTFKRMERNQHQLLDQVNDEYQDTENSEFKLLQLPSLLD